MIPTFTRGEELRADDLNALAEMAGAGGSLSVDGSSGMEYQSFPGGRTVRTTQPLEIWVKITGGGGSGVYAGTQQLESDASGTWVDGPRVYTFASGRLREANGTTTVPIGGTVIVRAYKDGFTWRFNYGACS